MFLEQTVNTYDMSMTETAERTLNYLGVQDNPLTRSFLVSLFDHLQTTAPHRPEYYDLQDELKDVQRDLRNLSSVLDEVRNARDLAEAKVREIAPELNRLRFEKNGGIINWEQLCRLFPHCKISIIKQVRTLTGAGLKEAIDLVDASVREEGGVYVPVVAAAAISEKVLHA